MMLCLAPLVGFNAAHSGIYTAVGGGKPVGREGAGRKIAYAIFLLAHVSWLVAKLRSDFALPLGGRNRERPGRGRQLRTGIFTAKPKKLNKFFCLLFCFFDLASASSALPVFGFAGRMVPGTVLCFTE
jgi:hypothetical protein